MPKTAYHISLKGYVGGYDFDRSIRQSLAAPVSANSEHFWPRLRFASLRLKTATAFGSRDYSLRLALCFTPTPLLRHGVGRFGLLLRS